MDIYVVNGSTTKNAAFRRDNKLRGSKEWGLFDFNEANNTRNLIDGILHESRVQFFAHFALKQKQLRVVGWTEIVQIYRQDGRPSKDQIKQLTMNSLADVVYQ